MMQISKRHLFAFVPIWCIASLLIVPTTRVLAHDPHPEWMMDPTYKNGQGEHCCSPNRDCNPIPDSDLELTPQGWKYLPTGEIVPGQNTFRSRDTTHWRCQGPISWHGKSMTRCLFVAPGTT